MPAACDFLNVLAPLHFPALSFIVVSSLELKNSGYNLTEFQLGEIGRNNCFFSVTMQPAAKASRSNDSRVNKPKVCVKQCGVSCAAVHWSYLRTPTYQQRTDYVVCC